MPSPFDKPVALGPRKAWLREAAAKLAKNREAGAAAITTIEAIETELLQYLMNRDVEATTAIDAIATLVKQYRHKV